MSDEQRRKDDETMAKATQAGVMSWFTDKSPVAPPSFDDLLAAKKEFEKVNDDHLRRLAVIRASPGLWPEVVEADTPLEVETR